MRKLFLLLFLIPVLAVAQQKQITLEDIYKKGTFRGEFVPGFAGEDIDSLVKATDVKDEAGKPISLGDHLVSDDKKRILIFTGRESIYRRSSKATAYLHDIIAKKQRSWMQKKSCTPLSPLMAVK